MALQNVGASAFLLLMPLFIQDALGWGSAQFAVLMTSFVLTMALTQIALFTPVQKAVGLLRLGLLANVCNGCAFLGYSLVRDRSPLSKATFAAVSLLSERMVRRVRRHRPQHATRRSGPVQEARQCCACALVRRGSACLVCCSQASWPSRAASSS